MYLEQVIQRYIPEVTGFLCSTMTPITNFLALRMHENGSYISTQIMILTGLGLLLKRKSGSKNHRDCHSGDPANANTEGDAI
jgi:hypothetical protein